MKKKFILVACLAAFVCSCQQNQADTKKMNKDGSKDQNMDDQNYQDRRKSQNAKPQGGCCEAEKPSAPQQNQTVASPEIKVEKAQ